MPRYMRVLIAAELLGVVAAAVFLIHMVSSATPTVGRITQWNAPQSPSPPAAVTAQAVPVPTPRSAASPHPQASPSLASSMWTRLNANVGETARGEQSILSVLETALAQQITQLLNTSTKGH